MTCRMALSLEAACSLTGRLGTASRSSGLSAGRGRSFLSELEAPVEEVDDLRHGVF